MELRPVAEHDRDRVAASDAEPGETAGERIDAAEQIRPRQRDGVIDGAYGHDFGWFAAVRRPASVTVGASTARPALRDRAAFHALLQESRVQTY